MRTHLTTVLLALLVSSTFAAQAFASHPARPSWTSTIDSAEVPDCFFLYEPEGDTALLDIDNQCPETFTVESVTCDPVTCEPQEIIVESGGEHQITPIEIGLDAGLQEGDKVVVELFWTLDTTAEGTITLNVVFNGFVGGEHNFDAGTTGDVSTGTGDAGDSEADGGGETADAGDGTDEDRTDGDGSGTKSDPSGCGGCATAAGSASSVAMAFLTLAMIAARRRL